MFPANVAGEKTRKGVNFLRTAGVRMLCRPSRYLCLYRIEGLQRDDGFMSILGVVLRQLTVVDERPLDEIIFAECGLKQKVSGVGVIA